MGLSATQRFTYTLLQLGYLRRDETSRLYALSPKTLEFGRRYLQSSELVERAMPYLLHLHQTCGETTNLTLLDGEEIVFVSRFLSRNVFNVDVVVGTRLPAFCTAPGLAMLARLDPSEAEAILRRTDRRAFTASYRDGSAPDPDASGDDPQRWLRRRLPGGVPRRYLRGRGRHRRGGAAGGRHQSRLLDHPLDPGPGARDLRPNGGGSGGLRLQQARDSFRKGAEAVTHVFHRHQRTRLGHSLADADQLRGLFA
jgi:hypothetical protein